MMTELRQFREEDRSAICEMIRREWNFDRYGPGWMRLAGIFLDGYLRGSDGLFVLEDGGSVAGMLSYRYHVGAGHDSDVDAAASMDPSEIDAEKAAKDLRAMFEADKAMYSRLDTEGMGELMLIMIGTEFKGKGYGKMLFNHAAEKMREAGCRGMLFVSDTDCDTGFYDHIGARLAEREDISISIYPGERFTRLVYRYDL